MGRVMLYVPADTAKPIEACQALDGETDPFKAAATYLEQNMEGFTGYCERVRFSYADHYLMVDESGHLVRQPLNRRASVFYPFAPYLVGDVVIVHAPEVYTSEGPDLKLADIERPVEAKLRAAMALALEG